MRVVFLLHLDNRTISISCEAEYLVEEIRPFIRRKTGIPLDEQQLILNGKYLEDGHMMSEYLVDDQSNPGISHNHMYVNSLNEPTLVEEKAPAANDTLSMTDNNLNQLSHDF